MHCFCLSQILQSTHIHTHTEQLYGHMPPIWQTIQVKWTIHWRHYWRRKYEHIRDVLLWTPTHGHTSVDRPTNTYVHYLLADNGCSQKDLPEAMDDRYSWREDSQGNPCCLYNDNGFGLVLWHINHCRLFNAKYNLSKLSNIWFVITFAWWHF